MELVALTFCLTLVVSVLSGLSGGGGGFILTPYLIFIGLTPQQAIATGKMAGLGVAGGAMIAFKGKGLVNRRLALPLMIMTFSCALAAAYFLPKIDAEFLQRFIGGLLIVLVPTLFINKKSLKPGHRSKRAEVFGFMLAFMIILFQTMIGSGMATLLVLVLMFCFGLTALEANATKRVAQVVQAALLTVLLFVQGLVMLGHGLAAMTGSFIGCHIGSKIALKKGSQFVKFFLAITMLASGIALLVS
jgi:uncharacterized membrane protein YfcA